MMRTLLDAVLDDPSLNTKTHLLSKVHDLLTAGPAPGSPLPGEGKGGAG